MKNLVNAQISDLADQFIRVELHAARSGREVLRVLKNIIIENRDHSIAGLAEIIHANIRYLLDYLPPYAPPINSINRVLVALEQADVNGEGPEEIIRTLSNLQAGAVDPGATRKQISKSLAPKFNGDTTVYTHTLSETVLGTLLELNEMGLLRKVIVTESRPNNDGWVTARRLADNGITVDLTIDAAMPLAIQGADLMLSGAEIIYPDGSVIGKIGASLAAKCCQDYEKPVYIIAGSDKINIVRWSGSLLNPITKGELGINKPMPGVNIIGCYFDLTPSHLIAAYATEKGLFERDALTELLTDMEVSNWLEEQLRVGSRNKIGEGESPCIL